MTTNKKGKLSEMLEMPTRTTTNVKDLGKQTYLHTGIPKWAETQTTPDILKAYLSDEIYRTGSGDDITNGFEYTMVDTVSQVLQNALVNDITSLIEQNTGSLNDFDRIALNKKILNVCLALIDTITERFVKLEKEIEQTRITLLSHTVTNRVTLEQLDSLNEHVLRELRRSIIDIKESTK